MKSKRSRTKNVGIVVVVARYGLIVFYLSVFTFTFSLSAHAQHRDYFTAEEIELIRDAQQIDDRIVLLTKTIDRRFAVLKINVGGSNPTGKDWGEPPTGTPTELFSDIRNILQKAVDDIDNLSERPDSMVVDPDAPKDKKKKPIGFSDVFPKAVKNLAAAARRYERALKTALDAATDERQKGLIADSIDLCEEITAAVPKLPADAANPKKNGKDH